MCRLIVVVVGCEEGWYGGYNYDQVWKLTLGTGGGAREGCAATAAGSLTRCGPVSACSWQLAIEIIQWRWLPGVFTTCSTSSEAWFTMPITDVEDPFGESRNRHHTSGNTRELTAMSRGAYLQMPELDRCNAYLTPPYAEDMLLAWRSGSWGIIRENTTRKERHTFYFVSCLFARPM